MKLGEKQLEVLLSEEIRANPVCHTLEGRDALGRAAELQDVVLEVVQVTLCNVFGEQLLSKILRTQDVDVNQDKAIGGVQVSASSVGQVTVNSENRRVKR